mgnify:FL=1
MEDKFNTIEEAIEDYKIGRPIIVADDEHRENEGDLIIAAEFATAKIINFMISECKGLVCVSIEKDKADTLSLSEMVSNNTDVKGTAFCQSVDADPQFGVTTGISAYDRAKTIEVILNKNTKPKDLRRPGHVFPLIARKGGVLSRTGHTEASVDLAKLAGLEPCAVICEIVKEDGTMARREDLFKFAQKHNIKFITVADLIKYRLKTERFITREAQATLPTPFGTFQIIGYKNQITLGENVALVLESEDKNKIPLVRMHSECLTGDVFHSLRCDCGNQLHASLKMIQEHGCGALVYIKEHEGRGIGLINKIKAYALQDEGQDTVQANVSLGFEPDLRDYGIGAQILLDLNFKKFNLITNNPKKIIGLKGYDLEVVERIPTKAYINEFNQKYMETKVKKMEHMLNL